MESFIINEQARRLAINLLAQAVENEPPITADLQNTAQEISAEMVGLENRFKSEGSLTRKLADKSYGDLTKLLQEAESVNDVLRYTFVLPIETYAESFHQTVEILRKRLSFRVPKRKIWNAWRKIGSNKDRGYRGINITVISSQKQKFELQFHTAESFRLKTETHFLYEESRDVRTSGTRIVKIIEMMKKAAADLQRPDGV